MGIVTREVQRATAGASTSTAAAGRSGGVLFVYCFGATLNAHVHLHLCMLDGVVAQERRGLLFRGAWVLGLFERRGLLSSETVGVMQGWGQRGGFSVHAGERVAAQDSVGRERLLRYFARPMFAAERLVRAGEGAQVRYRLTWAALQGHRVGQQRPLELRLSASECLDRVALVMPPPRKYRHHYFGVLAPNSLSPELKAANLRLAGPSSGEATLSCHRPAGRRSRGRKNRARNFPGGLGGEFNNAAAQKKQHPSVCRVLFPQLLSLQ